MHTTHAMQRLARRCLTVVGLSLAMAAGGNAQTLQSALLSGTHGDSTIDSVVALEMFLATVDRRSHPLWKMSEQGRTRFLQSLRFNENGLTSYAYIDLVEELGAADLHRVLAMLGQGHQITVLEDVRVETRADAEVIETMLAGSGECGEYQSTQQCPDMGIPNAYCREPGSCAPETGTTCMKGC